MKDDRDEKVRAVLEAATEPLGPTEISRRINAPWCCCGSSAIVPVLRRIGAVKVAGRFGKYRMPASNQHGE